MAWPSSRIVTKSPGQAIHFAKYYRTARPGPVNGLFQLVKLYWKGCLVPCRDPTELRRYRILATVRWSAKGIFWQTANL